MYLSSPHHHYQFSIVPILPPSLLDSAFLILNSGSSPYALCSRLAYYIGQGDWFKVPKFPGKFYSYSFVFLVNSGNNGCTLKPNCLFLPGVIRWKRECDDCVIFDFESSPLLCPDESSSLAHINTCSVQGMTRSLLEKFHTKTLSQSGVFATIGRFHGFIQQRVKYKVYNPLFWQICKNYAGLCIFRFW